MNLALIDGVEMHGEFSSSDASALNEANSRFALYGGGGTSAATLDAKTYVFVTDIVITTAAALTITVYDGADNSVGAGEIVAKAKVNGTQVINLRVPHRCQIGTYPKVAASASGQVDVQIKGAVYSHTP